MWTAYESWQVAELERLADQDLDGLEIALNEMWRRRPQLLEQVALSALDRDRITPEHAAQVLKIEREELDAKLAQFRKRALKRRCVVVGDGAIARLAEGGLPVWEIVRAYRALGSLEALHEAFSGASAPSLESALAYAEEHPAEIERQIDRYEQLLERRKNEYPRLR